MNHLEQLVAEWLQYRGYFVRVSVPVGRRKAGGYEGELDVVAFNGNHFMHIECSLDALSDAQRQDRFAAKFERGQKYAPAVFGDWTSNTKLDQVVVLLMASGRKRDFGGGRLVTVRELTREIFDGLRGTSPLSGAVSSNLPLLRTLQLAAFAQQGAPPSGGEGRIIPAGAIA